MGATRRGFSCCDASSFSFLRSAAVSRWLVAFGVTQTFDCLTSSLHFVLASEDRFTDTTKLTRVKVYRQGEQYLVRFETIWPLFREGVQSNAMIECTDAVDALVNVRDPP